MDPPGGTYLKVEGLWDGSWDFFSLCAWCEVRKNWLGEECRAWQFLEIVDDFESHFETKSESLAVIFRELSFLVEGGRE